MGTDLAVISTVQTNAPYDGGRLPAIQQLGALLSKSGYFADAREAAQAAVKVMAGEELGLAPIASMMQINIIKGKVALSANLMAAQVRRHGYNYRSKRLDNAGCVLDFLGRDGKVIGESSFTEEDAARAEIKSDMYKKYPRNMYFSRAMSNGVKWFCPEVTSGLPIYTPEELGATVDSEGDVVQEPAGSQAAANQVAERKIAEMKAAPKRQTKVQPSAATSDTDAMQKAFAEIRNLIGAEAFGVLLGNNGYEKPEDITYISKGRAIYAEMVGYSKSRRQPQPAVKLAEEFTADESDLPDEMWTEGRS
jgi:hypothetical protein